MRQAQALKRHHRDFVLLEIGEVRQSLERSESTSTGCTIDVKPDLAVPVPRASGTSRDSFLSKSYPPKPTVHLS